MFGRSRRPRLGSELVCGTEVAGGGLGILSNRLGLLLPQLPIKLVNPLLLVCPTATPADGL